MCILIRHTIFESLVKIYTTFKKRNFANCVQIRKKCNKVKGHVITFSNNWHVYISDMLIQKLLNTKKYKNDNKKANLN